MKYDFTPGTPATASTNTSAGSPPHFTYAGTAIVDRGAVGFAVPSPFGFAGEFTDKPWMEVDLNSPSSSPCAGSVYVAYTAFHGLGGNSPIMVSRSADGGATFSAPRPVSTGGSGTTPNNQGVDVAVASDGTVHVAYRTFRRADGTSTISVVKSSDCGRQWSQPVAVAPIADGQAPGVAFGRVRDPPRPLSVHVRPELG